MSASGGPRVVPAPDRSPGLNVLVTGGSGPTGIAVARALRQAGFRVFTVGSDRTRIDAAATKAGDGVTPLVCDLADPADVQVLRTALAGTAGAMDGVIHLVGGWRGAKGITDQSDAAWDFLERGAITTLRNVSRAFYADLAAAGTGRFAMVSSTAVDKPTATTASYVAAKAAAETWTLAMAEGLAREAADNGTALRGAAVVLVVKALVDAELRTAHPERTFPGATDVEDLAAAVVGLFSRPAAELNGRRLLLTP
ncbi:SDR family oxidoreductase [Pseudarthrobacter sp. AL07]|uniref:SDR family oxidoreductase n=1 Tax=unclassified Pseudarthrobacter TaxID=2647000 RepID=UPI00249B01AA|nr:MULTISPECIES: SDR family oxidoreductase [unclassified Pseudarthrobacter]MDI3194640.1 SDR family oxidoreductase [Pseudarthrobacter sp. AL20]MDI3208707.1 SDR family oxidoreductase [Pseudarthrobacter sp. AL07]